MIITVVHTFGRNAGATLAIDKDVVRFGRAPTNDVVFDPEFDRDASATHAELRREGSEWVLVDLGSRNGTFVGGERVGRRVVQSGDEIMFGTQGPRVRLSFGGALAPAAQPPQDRRALGGPSAGEPWRAAAGQILEPSKAASLPVAGPELRNAPHGLGSAGAAPAAGQRVGQRTIAMLISSAIATARSGRPQGGMNTRVLEQYVDERVGDATAGQRRTTFVLAGLFVVSLLALAGLVLVSSQSRDEIDRLRGQLANLSPNDPRRKEIESRLGSLHPSNASFGRNLYDQSRRGIFMLVASGQGFCTAFAVRPQVLATNAHCIAAARKHTGIVALENEGRGDVSYSITDMRMHPGYRETDQHTLTPDVGIVMISGRAATVLSMATSDELARVGAGDDVYLIGFPGRLMDASHPAATFLAAHVGRITSASGQPRGFVENWLVQHDAPTTHGTSGSPIFNGHGKVVAINSGGYLEGDDETISGRKTEVVKASPYKFGMRIDLLNAVLK